MAYKYCEETTQSQSLYRGNLSCISTLKDIVKREGGGVINPTAKVVDLDAVAQSNHPHQTPSTMDVAFCVAEHKEYNGKEKTVNGKWCLVEFKYDVDSTKTLKKDKLVDKVNGSKQLIGYDIPFYGKYYIVFSNKELGRNILNRIFAGNPKSPYIPFDTTDLLQEFF